MGLLCWWALKGLQVIGLFHSWSHRFVNLGGRVILLNSILNAIPIFFLKNACKGVGKVWWGFKEDSFGVVWMGMLRSHGCGCVMFVSLRRWRSLWVRYLWLVNLSLLDKWKRKLLSDNSSLEFDILFTRDGISTISSLQGESLPVFVLVQLGEKGFSFLIFKRMIL